MKARLRELFSNQITGEWGTECKDTDVKTPVLRTTNFTAIGEINYENIACRNISAKKIENKHLATGDIILEKSGGTDSTPVGRVVYCDDKIENETYLCNNFTQAMRPNPKKSHPKYLFYAMWNLHQSGMTNLMQNKTTGIRNLQVTRYLDILVPLPPLNEQKKIANELDKITDIITKRKAQLKKLDLLVKSRFIEMFGDPVENNRNWNIKLFGDVCCVRQGLQIPIAKRLVVKEDDCYEYITVAYLHGTKEREYIKKPKATVICKKSDILMTRTGNTGMVVTDVEGVFHNNFFLIDFNKNLLNKKFVVQYLNLDTIQKELLRRAGTAIIPDLNHGEFYKVKIYIPPIALQTQFATFVSQVDKSKSSIQHSLTQLETLKKAKMQLYFE